MTERYIVANWKMNMSLADLNKWFDNFVKAYCECDTLVLRTIVAPSTVFLSVASLRAAKNIELASQDISLSEKGAHTGESGAFQIKEYVKYGIIGHSERKEEKETVLRKRDLCLENGIKPIVCFIDPEEVGDYYKDGVMLAWEDPENISSNGSLNPKDPKDIETTVKNMKSVLPEGAVIIYGGSVSSGNIGDLVKISELDGVLVGSSSLDPLAFLDIIRAYEIYEP
ncbi:MAG: triose-phosphate isomerase family protein [Patescibacteria group bacterium]|jgi:triosephosphate isomerase